MAKKTEAELADYYNRTQDTSDFDDGEEVSITVRRDVTISVRFSVEEIAELRARAEEAGVKVTPFIRAAALERPVRSIARRWVSLPVTWSSEPIRSPSS